MKHSFNIIVASVFACLTCQVKCQAWTHLNAFMAGTKASYGYVDTVAHGAQKGLDECKEQFKWDVWNCPPTMFTQIFNKNNNLPSNRETAFVHAVISAGIVHTITKNCSRGQFDKCACDSRKTSKMDSDEAAKGGFRWGGCSDDISFGMEIAKSYLDSRESGHDNKAKVNLHNNNVGRMAVQNTMKKLCKCHGVSGSCQLQTCWMRVADFSVVGAYLKDAYRKAIKVSNGGTPNIISRIKRGLTHQLTVGSISSSPSVNSHSDINFDLSLDDKVYPETASVTVTNEFDLPIGKLAYIEESPNYCSQNVTLGRICSKRKGDDVSPEERRSCRQLCKRCGLRVKRQKKKVTRQCNCRFEWCCTVHCDVCETEEETYTCALARPFVH